MKHLDPSKRRDPQIIQKTKQTGVLVYSFFLGGGMQCRQEWARWGIPSLSTKQTCDLTFLFMTWLSRFQVMGMLSYSTEMVDCPIGWRLWGCCMDFYAWLVWKITTKKGSLWQGSLNYPFWRDQTMPMYAHLKGISLTTVWVGCL